MFKKQIWHEFNINFDLQHNTYRIRDDTNYGFWAKPKRKKSIKINLATCSLRLKSYNEKKIQTEGNNKLGNSYCAQASVRVCTIEALVLNRSSRVIPDEATATNKSGSLKTAKTRNSYYYFTQLQHFTYMLQFFQVKIFKGGDCLLETLPTFSRNKTYWQENVKSLTMFPIFSLTLKLSDSLCCFLHENWVSK